MKKNIFYLALSALLFALSVRTEAQQPTKVHRLGYLAPGPGIGRSEEVFREHLRELGYIEGENLVIEWRHTKGKADLRAQFVAELVSLKPDCILAVGVETTRAVKQATRTIPIVMGNASDDPVRLGLITSLARPGENVTGFTDMAPDLAGKRLELLKETFPKISRLGHLWDGASRPGTTHLKEIEAPAEVLRVRVQPLDIRRPDDLENAFQTAHKSRTDALIVVHAGFVNSHRRRITDLAIKHRLPVMYTNTQFSFDGGLMSYAPDPLDRMRRAAGYVDKILKGTNAGELPVQQPAKFEFIINLKTAKQMALIVPPNVLARADRVIK